MPIDITRSLKKYIPIFQEAHELGINEAETSMRISKFIEDVLGYDVFTDVSKEYTVKDRYVDYAIKLNNKTVFFIEVKQAGMELRKSFIEQAGNYAANAGVYWVVLTSGRYWQIYHLTFDEGIQSDLIWSADIIEDDIKRSSFLLSLLHKKSILRGELEDYYLKVKTLSPKSIIQSIFHEDSLKVIRRHLKESNGISVDEDELTDSITEMLSKEAWEEIGDVKIKRKRKINKQKTEEPQAMPPQVMPSEPVIIAPKTILPTPAIEGEKQDKLGVEINPDPGSPAR